MQKIKHHLKSIPIVGSCLLLIWRIFRPAHKFPGSSSYWEERYARGETSGSGSYNRLAAFKAEVLNEFVAKNNIQSIVEFGCGDGNQLSLAKYPKYIGLDVSSTIIAKCQQRFEADSSKSFFELTAASYAENCAQWKSEVALSIDVIFHLVEDHIFDAYMRQLFSCSEKYVIVYSSNYETEQTYHERDRMFTRWVDQNMPQWKLKEQQKNPFPFDKANPDNTSKCDFFFYTLIN